MNQVTLNIDQEHFLYILVTHKECLCFFLINKDGQGYDFNVIKLPSSTK